MGVSIENNDYVHRADDLRSIPAAARVLSLEPLLGPVPDLDLTGIDWVVVGGETGKHARPVDPEWVRDIRDRCVEANVALFFKQWGGETKKKKKTAGRILDGRTWDQYPMGTRVCP
jgi:protein gp37